MHTGLLAFFVIVLTIFSGGIPASVLRQNNPPVALEAWSFVDPIDPQLPVLISKQAGSYRLDNTWKIKSIEYLYQWWGLGQPVFDYQVLNNNGNNFLNDKTVIDAAKVNAFVNATKDLYPTQFLLAGTSHTDDYPSWTIQITGEDGNIVLLYASSNGNPGGAPWNILYNGRMYVQYTGALAEPLSTLFTGRRGQPAAAFFPGGDVPGMISFSTQGYPRQLTQGFTGLLPIAEGFQYGINLQNNSIDGVIRGRESIGGYGNMVIGTITQLTKINLILPDESSVPCPIKLLPSNDPSSAEWSFSCPLPDQEQNEIYKLPITVTFATDSNDKFTISGELHGKWGTIPDVLLIPVDEQIRNLLVENNNANNILKDHVLAFATYNAQINPKDINEGILNGEAVFVGQTKVAEQTIRYTVSTSFAVENGKLTHWAFDRKALDHLFSQAIQAPITKRAVQADKNMILNLSYVESTEPPKSGRMLGSGGRRYEVNIGGCHGEAPIQVPDQGKPLEAFSFNNSWTLNNPDFLLIDNKVLVYDVDLFPLSNDRGEVLSALLPDVFKTSPLRAFGRVLMSNQGLFDHQPTLILWLPNDATQKEIENYQQIAKVIGGKLDKQYEPLWTIKGVNFMISDSGKIEIEDCKN